jgi:dTDP-4-amino-4,6-dideoxygalactose transaminase
MTIFSFHPAKPITCGEGGAVLTNRAELAERLRRVRHHGIRYPDPGRPWRYEIEQPGQNYRLTDFQCALGLSQMKKLDAFWVVRDRLARRYHASLAGSRFVELPGLPQGVRHAWHLFVVLLRLERLSADQDLVLQTLRAENIGVQLHYPLVYHHPFYRKRFGYEPGLCPLAESVERRLMTLPLFASMSESDQDDVLHALEKVFAHYAKL